MNEAERAAVARVLRDRAAALEARLAGMTAPPERGSGISFGKRVGDGNSLESSHARVLRALRKLDDGTYGTCDVCGRPIAAARLRFSPEAVLCIDCARAAR
jgi:DnaK suppressor protein